VATVRTPDSDEAGLEKAAKRARWQPTVIDGLVDESSLHFACAHVDRASDRASDRAKDGLPCHGRGAPTAGMSSQAQRSRRG
jgi:hypothetical protein